MKQLLAFLITLFSLKLSAQIIQEKTDDNKIGSVYYTYLVQGGVYDKQTEEWIWTDGKEERIEIELQKNTARIYNNANTIITSYENLGKKTKIDNDGDKYIQNTFRAYDNKKRKCLFSIVAYTDKPITYFMIVYADTGFRYYVENDRLSNFLE